jgi:DNA-binding MarR family transcriptional regulator
MIWMTTRSARRTAASSIKATVPSPTSPRGCTNFKLRQLTRRVTRHYDAFVGDGAGVKTTQYSLLSHLAVLGAVQPSALAADLGLEASTLTRNLQPLVAQGWVEIGPGADGRSRLVHITDAGRAKRIEAQRAWKQAQLAMNQKLGEDRVVRLHALIDECLTLLNEPDELDAHDEGTVHE